MTILWLDINLFLFQILEFLQSTWVDLIHTVVKGQILFMLLDGEKFCACCWMVRNFVHDNIMIK